MVYRVVKIGIYRGYKKGEERRKSKQRHREKNELIGRDIQRDTDEYKMKKK